MKSIQIELKWALIFSFMTLCWMGLEKLIGLHDQHIAQHMIYTNLYAIPAITLMTLALRNKKATVYQGKITYVQGLKSGLILSILIALISPFTQLITSYIISPNYFKNIAQYSVKQGYYPDMETALTYFNFNSYVVQGMVGALVMGVLTTLIVMIFLKNNKQES